MLLKPVLQARLGQQLTMTPQLRQAIRLLQMSSLELKTEIQETFESNPLLETDEDHEQENPPVESSQTEDNGYLPEVSDNEIWSNGAPADVLRDYNSPSSQGRQSEHYSGYLEDQGGTEQDSLERHLLWQLELSSLSERDHVVATALINALDESGYLRETLENIRQNLHASYSMELELDEIEAILKLIQRFDPVGCGARCLRECLEIQLQQMPEDTPFLSVACLIVARHLDAVGRGNHLKLMKSTGFSGAEVESAVTLIQSLHPKPGDLINVQKPEYIIPDVYVHRHKDAWRVTLNRENTPGLRINDTYFELLKSPDKNGERDYVRHQLQDARWFIKCLQNRNETLLRVAASIVKHQKNFLEYGEAAMRPLVLRDVAKELDMHESTISRATTNKYMSCPRGTFEFKYFFSSHVNTHNGGACSATAVKSIIGDLIKEEDHARPLSDNKIAMLFKQKGIHIARRTIAKYRESMAIPSSNERRKYPYKSETSRYHAKNHMKTTGISR